MTQRKRTPRKDPYNPFPKIDGDFLTSEAEFGRRVVCVLINPVDHRPVQVLAAGFDSGYPAVMIGNPVDDLDDFEDFGRGGLDAPSDVSNDYKRCLSSHVGEGVVYRGVGHGLMLYAGLVMSVELAFRDRVFGKKVFRGRDAHPEEPCIASPRGGRRRSTSSDKFWKHQIETGIARADTVLDEFHRSVKVPLERMPTDKELMHSVSRSDYDGPIQSTEYKYSTFLVSMNMKVDMMHVDQIRNARLILHDKFGTEPPENKILLKLDLRATSSEKLREYIAGWLERRGASKRVVADFLRANERVVGPGRIKRNEAAQEDAWLGLYGSLAEPIDD